MTADGAGDPPSRAGQAGTGPARVVALANDYPAGSTIDWHRHETDQILHASDGVMTVEAEDGLWVVPPQRALWIPAGVDHTINVRGPLAMRTLYLRPGWAAALPRRCCVVPVPPLVRAVILRVIDRQAREGRDGPAVDRLMAVLHDELAALGEVPLALPMPRDPRIRRVAESLLDDPARADSMADFSRDAGTSPSTLARLFRRETGMSFAAWRQQRRLLRALELLAEGEPVGNVAATVGYDSPSAFTAAFRRSLGVPPGRWFDPMARDGDGGETTSP